MSIEIPTQARPVETETEPRPETGATAVAGTAAQAPGTAPAATGGGRAQVVGGGDGVEQGRGALDLRGGPGANRAMDGAFSGSAPGSQVRPARAVSYSGPTVGPGELTERNERRLLRGAGRGAVIAAYGGFDPSRPPVVLVHGLSSSGAELEDIAARLHAEGHQVFIAFYKDRGDRTHDSGRALAFELLRLRESHYPEGTPLNVVAHSMGGLVSRAALNYLQDPGWLGETTGITATPRAGFGPVQVRTLDTPWDGFDHEPDIPIIGAIMRFFAWLFMAIAGWIGAYDMRGSSEMFEHLFDPQLEGVEIQNHAAREAGEPDKMRSLPDLEPNELRDVGRFILDGRDPGSHRARNMAMSLRQDARYAELQRVFRERLAASPATDRNAALIAAYDQVMPRFAGDHNSVLRDDPNRDDDLIDRVARDLRP